MEIKEEFFEDSEEVEDSEEEEKEESEEDLETHIETQGGGPSFAQFATHSAVPILEQTGQTQEVPQLEQELEDTPTTPSEHEEATYSSLARGAEFQEEKDDYTQFTDTETDTEQTRVQVRDIDSEIRERTRGPIRGDLGRDVDNIANIEGIESENKKYFDAEDSGINTKRRSGRRRI